MNEETSLNLVEYVEIIKKRSKMITLITLASVIIAAVLSFFIMKPVYEAQTSIIVGKPAEEQNTNTNYTDVMMYQNLVKTYSEIAASRLVAQTAVSKLNSGITLKELQGSITVTPETGTQILIIKAQSKSPEEAADMINAVSDAFVSEAKVVFPTGGDIQIMDKAVVPQAPVKPNKKLNVAIALLLGLMVSVGLAFILEYMDRTLKTEEDIEKYLEIPVIGIIPKVTNK